MAYLNVFLLILMVNSHSSLGFFQEKLRFCDIIYKLVEIDGDKLNGSSQNKIVDVLPHPMKFTNNFSTKDKDCKPSKGVLVSNVILYAMGFTIIVMFLVILGLSWALYKEKHTIKLLNNTNTNPSDAGHIKQSPTEFFDRSLSKMRSNESKIHFINESSFSRNVDDISISNIHVSITQKRNDYQMPIKKAKADTYAQQIISPHQMDEIIKGVLLKTKKKNCVSLSDLNNILEENSPSVNESDSPSNKEFKKFASTPDLDTYDEVPTPVRLKEKTNDDNENLYDFPLKQENVILTDETGRYLLPITSRPHIDPSYVNAKKTKPDLIHETIDLDQSEGIERIFFF